MTLLRGIQEAATGTEVPISTLLRKAQILASRLEYVPLRDWASKELSGYEAVDELPDYRRLGKVLAIGDFSGPMGAAIRNQPIPESAVPEQWREQLFTHNVYESVAEIEAILARHEDGLKYPWPADVSHPTFDQASPTLMHG